MVLFHTSCGFPKASPSIFSMFLIIATFWWAFNGYSILFGVGAPWNIKKSSLAWFCIGSLFHLPPVTQLFTHKQLWRGKSSFQKQTTWCHEVLTLTMCANNSLPEKILWDGTMQAVLVLTLYQKFTVMVIPPFRRDSIWCHLHGNHIKKKKRNYCCSLYWNTLVDEFRQH